MLKAMLQKEFILIFRDKHALAALFLMPAVFILIMSMALKDAFNENSTLIKYELIDKDNSSYSIQLKTILDEDNNLEIVESKFPIKAVDSGHVQFLVTIPVGYGERFTLNTEDPKLLSVVVASDVKADLAAFFKSKLFITVMDQQLSKLKKDIYPGSLKDKLDQINFDESSIMNVRYANRIKRPTSVQQTVPSWIVFGMFFIVIPMSTIFISERDQNTLKRLQAMNISLPMFYLGKIIPYMIINQIQVWLMIFVGIYIVPMLGADPLTLGNSILGLFLLSLSISCSAIGFSLLIASAVQTVEQATTIGGIFNILLGAIGGVMIPTFIMPDVMQSLSLISPMSWGLEGFLDLFLRDEGISGILTKVLALLSFGIFGILGSMYILSYKMRRNS